MIGRNYSDEDITEILQLMHEVSELTYGDIADGDYPATEKLEIIRIVEHSHLPAKQTLDMLGVPRRTFYRWYDRYRLGGDTALKDKAPMPARVWNRMPDNIEGTSSH